MRKPVLPYDEVKRYAGVRGEPTVAVDALIRRAIAETEKLIEPRYISKTLSVKIDGECLNLGGLELKSRDLARLLRDKSQVVLLCATVGFKIEKAIERYALVEPAYALVLDAAAAAAIECVCDGAEKELLGDCEHTGRFSPGYGDLSIDYQTKIIELINAARLIGVTVSASKMLSPMKSVTAFIGISGGGCKACPQKDCLARNE